MEKNRYYTGVQIYRYGDKQILYRYTDVQIYRYTHAKIKMRSPCARIQEWGVGRSPMQGQHQGRTFLSLYLSAPHWQGALSFHHSQQTNIKDNLLHSSISIEGSESVWTWAQAALLWGPKRWSLLLLHFLHLSSWLHSKDGFALIYRWTKSALLPPPAWCRGRCGWRGRRPPGQHTAGMTVEPIGGFGDLRIWGYKTRVSTQKGEIIFN